jgi:hypothetical protein
VVGTIVRLGVILYFYLSLIWHRFSTLSFSYFPYVHLRVSIKVLTSQFLVPDSDFFLPLITISLKSLAGVIN